MCRYSATFFQPPSHKITSQTISFPFSKILPFTINLELFYAPPSNPPNDLFRKTQTILHNRRGVYSKKIYDCHKLTSYHPCPLNIVQGGGSKGLLCKHPINTPLLSMSRRTMRGVKNMIVCVWKIKWSIIRGWIHRSHKTFDTGTSHCCFGIVWCDVIWWSI